MSRSTAFLARATRTIKADGGPGGLLAISPERSNQRPGAARADACPPSVVHLTGPGGRSALHVPYRPGGSVGIDAASFGAGVLSLTHRLDAQRVATMTLRLQPCSTALASRHRLIRQGAQDERTTCIVLDHVPYTLGRAERALILERSAEYDPCAPASLLTVLRLSTNELVVSVHVEDSDQLFDHLPAIDALLDAVTHCPRTPRTENP